MCFHWSVVGLIYRTYCKPSISKLHVVGVQYCSELFFSGGDIAAIMTQMISLLVVAVQFK